MEMAVIGPVKAKHRMAGWGGAKAPHLVARDRVLGAGRHILHLRQSTASLVDAGGPS